MKNQTSIYSPAAAAVISCLLLSPSEAHAAPVTAQSADAFVDSIGINTHWSYGNVYSSAYSTLKTKLGAAGIRHIRDGLDPNLSSSWTRPVDLYNAYGIRLLAITGRRNSGGAIQSSFIDSELTLIKNNALAACEGLEGPNEYDISHGNDANWTASLQGYMQSLSSKVRADSQLKSRYIVGPSITGASQETAVGDLTSEIDFSCVHHYLSGRNPGTGGWGNNGYGSITYAIDYFAQVQSPSKPMQFTECGYHNAMTTTSGNDPITEAGEAKYMPRLYAEYFRRGISRAYKYELVDQGTNSADPESNFGLLRNDTSSKPSYSALSNLIAALKEPGASFAPDSLDFTISGSTANVRTVLLEKSSREYYLMIWQEVSSYSVTNRADLTVANASVTLTIPSSIGSAATCVPNDTTSWSSAAITSGSISLSVPDKILLVRLTPASRLLETESLAVAATSRDSHRVITGSGFSGGSGTILDANATGDFVSYTVPAVSAGRYDVKVGVKKYNPRGIFQLAISAVGGTPVNLGSPQDEYAATETYSEVDLGTWSPASSSDKLFKFTVTGKNASSSGYSISFDYIKLTPE